MHTLLAICEALFLYFAPVPGAVGYYDIASQTCVTETDGQTLAVVHLDNAALRQLATVVHPTVQDAVTRALIKARYQDLQ